MKRGLLIAFALFAVVAVIAAGSRPSIDEVPVTERKSPGGVAYALLQLHYQDTVAIAIAFECGVACDSKALSAAQYAPVIAARGGAAGMSPSETIEALKDFGVELNFTPNSDQTYLSLAAPDKGIDGAVTLVNKIITKPNLPDAAIARLGVQVAGMRAEQNNNMESKAFDAFVKAGMDAPAYDQYFRPEPGEFRNLKHDDMQKWLDAHLHRKGIFVAVTGNITQTRAGELVDKLLVGIPDVGLEITFPPVSFKSQDGAAITVQGDGGQQAEINFGSISARPKTLQEWLQGEMLTNIFASGMKSRLFTDIRIKLGATYGLMVDYNFFEDFSMNRVRGRVATDKLDAALAQLRASWKQFSEDGPTDAEIADAKGTELAALATKLRDHLTAAEAIRDDLTGHWTTQDIAQMVAMIKSADLRDKALLKKLFPPNPIIVVVK